MERFCSLAEINNRDSVKSGNKLNSSLSSDLSEASEARILVFIGLTVNFLFCRLCHCYFVFRGSVKGVPYFRPTCRDVYVNARSRVG